MKFDYLTIILLGIAGIALIVFLIWRNIKDGKDTNPGLTEDLESADKTKPTDERSK